MRISVILLIFLILFNGWGGILQNYDVDDQLGINAETGDAEELEKAQQGAVEQIATGKPVAGTTFNVVITGVQKFSELVAGVQPGVQMLVNIVPPGPVEDIIQLAGSLVPIIIIVDVLNYLRGIE